MYEHYDAGVVRPRAESFADFEFRDFWLDWAEEIIAMIEEDG
jgi:hypothetical protein